MGWEYSEISLHVYIMVTMGTACLVNMQDTLQRRSGAKEWTILHSGLLYVHVSAEGSVYVCVCGGEAGREEREEWKSLKQEAYRFQVAVNNSLSV